VRSGNSVLGNLSTSMSCGMQLPFLPISDFLAAWWSCNLLHPLIVLVWFYLVHVLIPHDQDRSKLMPQDCGSRMHADYFQILNPSCHRLESGLPLAASSSSYRSRIYFFPSSFMCFSYFQINLCDLLLSRSVSVFCPVDLRICSCNRAFKIWKMRRFLSFRSSTSNAGNGKVASKNDASNENKFDEGGTSNTSLSLGTQSFRSRRHGASKSGESSHPQLRRCLSFTSSAIDRSLDERIMGFSHDNPCSMSNDSEAPGHVGETE
jgi:hypothetical protein